MSPRKWNDYNKTYAIAKYVDSIYSEAKYLPYHAQAPCWSPKIMINRPSSYQSRWPLMYSFKGCVHGHMWINTKTTN